MLGLPWTPLLSLPFPIRGTPRLLRSILLGAGRIHRETTAGPCAQDPGSKPTARARSPCAEPNLVTSDYRFLSDPSQCGTALPCSNPSKPWASSLAEVASR